MVSLTSVTLSQHARDACQRQGARLGEGNVTRAITDPRSSRTDFMKEMIGMTQSTRRWVVGTAVALFLTLSWPAVVQADQWATASQSYRGLESYLKTQSHGASWRSYLALDQLGRELARGPAADRAVILLTLERLNSGAPGLDLAPFQALNRSLAQTLISTRADLTDAFLANKSRYQAIPDKDLLAARTTLQKRLQELRQYFARNGANGGAWIKYLRLEETDQQLAAGDKGDPEFIYNELMSLYTNGHPGLELAPIANAGKAIRHYADLLTVKQNPQVSIQHSQRMQQLSDLAKKLAADTVNPDTSAFAFLLGEMTAGRQNPELVEAARRLYSHPNLLFYAKKRFLAKAMEQHIDEVAPLTDNILGTSIRGTTHTVGDLTMDLRDDPQRAAFELSLNGHVTSKTIGVNGPAIVYAKGSTTIAGNKLIWLDESGMHDTPARGSAQTRTTFTGFASSSHFKKLVIKIASKRAYQNKAAAEYIASQRAADRVKKRINEQAATALAKSNSDIRSLRARVRDPLERWGIYPEEMHFNSNRNGINGSVLTADLYQLAAPSAPPAVKLPDAVDLEVRIHESLINNMASTIFAGRTLTRDYVETWLLKVAKEIPKEMQDEEQRDWSITLDVERPVSIAFADGGFTVQIRGTEYTSGDNSYPAMNVTANYKLEIGDKGIKAVRQGDVQIYPPEFTPGDQLTPQETALKRILTRRFEKLLKPEFVGEGFQLQGRLASYGKMYVRAVDSTTGWLQAGLGK